MSNNDNQKKPSSLPEGLSSIADDEAITEINLTDFLEESSKASPLFEGFHEDIERTEKSLESELQSLYDDIMSSGPETIVPKPMSVLTANEAEPSKIALSDPEIFEEPESTALDSLWMNPEDYFEDDIPVVSLDGAENAVMDGEIPDNAFFEPSAVDELASLKSEDGAKSDIFNMIDLLKSESDSETGFSDILSEIESNSGIAPVASELSSASQLVSDVPVYEEPAIETVEDEYEEVAFGEEEISWDELEYPSEEPAAQSPAVAPVPDAVPADFVIDVPAAVQTEPESDFDKELAVLLGDKKPEEEQTGFVINVPDDGVDYERAALASEKLYEAAPMSSQSLEDDPDFAGYAEDENAAGKKGESKGGAGDIIRKIVLTLSIITIIVSCGILVNTYFIEPYRFKSDADALVEQMSANIDNHDHSETVNEQIKTDNPDTEFPEGMLAKYAQLYAQNNDFAGWITIEGFGINLPIAQGDDNSYYLKRDIYKKYTSYGVPFFDYRISDLKNLHRNTMVYGHNMRHDDYIFGMLENYRTVEGYAQAPVIECNTIYGDHTWFVYGVFITNSNEKDDNGYFLPYNFVDVSTQKFAEYIKEVDKRKLYTTGVDINETDRILTLQACVYDFDGAMIVVVAREKRPGESISVDTSKAYKNPNPKYPQKWYDVNKKENPYAGDPRW